MPAPLDRAFGRRAFGSDPANYDRSRPDYPDWVWDTLSTTCALGPEAAAFEIGPGTGTATRRLLSAGAHVCAIEPDLRLADYLRGAHPGGRLEVLANSFEDANLPSGAFELGLSATSFHWLDEDPALAKIANLLKPGGWWAAVWNVFGDDSLPDPFHEATTALFEGAQTSPGAGGGGKVEFGLDATARIGALERTGAFEAIEHRSTRWPLELSADQTVALYATYSNVNARTDRAELLAVLGRVASEPPFNGRVVRNMTTSLFIARRR